MFRLLGIEWMKLKPYRAFWIFVILFSVMFPLIIYVGKDTFAEDANNKEMLSLFARSLMTNPFSFPGFWHYTAYCGGFLIILLGLVIIMHTCNEYNYKTHRQNIIDGWSRKQFILAKLVLVFTISLVATLYHVILTLAFGQGMASNVQEMFDPKGLAFILYFFIECLTYMTFALMIGILLRRSGLAIGLYFIYAYIIDNVLFVWLTNLQFKGARFLPLDSADSLVNNQLMQRIPQFEIDDTLRLSLLAACIIYIIIYMAVSFLRFAKKDL